MFKQKTPHLDCPNLYKTEAAVPCWMLMDRLWSRHKEFASPNTCLTQWPRALSYLGSETPAVSIITGVKQCQESRWLYFLCVFTSACSANCSSLQCRNWSMVEQMYLERLHPKLATLPRDSWDTIYNLSETDQRAPDVMEHELLCHLSSEWWCWHLHSFCSLSHEWQAWETSTPQWLADMNSTQR